ncbi:MAG TPA: glycoside hydrolase family 30 protein [Polyangiaceae bacterium]|nr:glycoside hydrolase family 30 protein [Polyangiaceae bacterium]
MNKLGMSFASLVLAWVATGCGSDGGDSNASVSTTTGNGSTSGGPGGTTTTTTNAGANTSNVTSGGASTTGASNTVSGVTTGNTTGTATTASGTEGTTGAGGMTSTGSSTENTTGTSSTTGGEVVPEPTLVTSGQGDYWNVGEVTEGGTSATFTVNTTQTFQEWHGWGGTFNEKGWDALQALSAEDRDRAMKLLFDVNEGIGFEWGRIPIGPSDYALTRYHLSDAPGQFSVEHDQSYLIPYIKAAQAIKGDVRYFASPWTPPPWAKSGTTENMGYDKGYFNTEYYEEYADFLISWIQAYEAEGIPIDSIMPQNEPGWAQSYPTCAWGPATDSTNNTELPNPVTLGTFVDQHLFPALDAAGLETNVWMGTLSNNKYFADYWNDMASKPSFERIVGGALQWENELEVGTVAATGKLVMQSEHKCGNYPWLGSQATSAADANRDNFLPNMAPNNHAYGEESWDLLKQWIDDGVHIYSAWNMVLDHEGFNLDEVRPWPQNAMLAVNKSTGELNVTPYYYVFRHVAQYVEVGAVRVGINGNALAFKNSDNSVVAIMFNEGSSASDATLSVDGRMVQFSIPARGWATVNLQPS